MGRIDQKTYLCVLLQAPAVNKDCLRQAEIKHDRMISKMLDMNRAMQKLSDNLELFNNLDQC